MPIDTEILLCDCSAGFDDTRRFAQLDELTLTYDVVERQGEGKPRVLRRHVASLRDARAHACATRPNGIRCPFGLDTPARPHAEDDDDASGRTARVSET